MTALNAILATLPDLARAGRTARGVGWLPQGRHDPADATTAGDLLTAHCKTLAQGMAAQPQMTPTVKATLDELIQATRETVAMHDGTIAQSWLTHDWPEALEGLRGHPQVVAEERAAALAEASTPTTTVRLRHRP